MKINEFTSKKLHVVLFTIVLGVLLTNICINNLRVEVWQYYLFRCSDIVHSFVILNIQTVGSPSRKLLYQTKINWLKGA